MKAVSRRIPSEEEKKRLLEETGSEVMIPPEIDVQITEEGKHIHILYLQNAVDVTPYKDEPETIALTHLLMAKTIREAANDLIEKWSEQSEGLIQ